MILKAQAGKSSTLEVSMLVYMITNNVNGHRYIGITVCTLEKRWREHRSAANTGSQKRLYKAMRKYGVENFGIEKIYDATSFEDLQQAEKKFIVQYETHASLNKGYNLTSGGEGRDRVDQLHGEQLPSVLNNKVIAFIRDPVRVGVSNSVLLTEVKECFGVDCSRDTIRDARRGDTWKHLNVEYPPIKSGQGANKAPATEEHKTKARAILAFHRPIALKKLAESRKGKRGPNAKLTENTVRDIFYNQESLLKTANKFGVSKKMVLLIKQRKAHVYLTQGL
jgi:predicted GIY-YIG superfamily endonuclease